MAATNHQADIMPPEPKADVHRVIDIRPDGSCPVVEITEHPPSFHNSGFQGFEVAKVGREQLKKDLAPTVLFELAKAVF